MLEVVNDMKVGRIKVKSCWTTAMSDSVIVDLSTILIFIHVCFCLKLQMELKMRLMELNWQKSQCVKIIASDERTRSEIRVGPHVMLVFFLPFVVKVQV